MGPCFVIVAAELIAADRGLDLLINDALMFLLVANKVLGTTVIGLIGFVVNLVLRRLEAQLLGGHPDGRGRA